jgi:cytochrome c
MTRTFLVAAAFIAATANVATLQKAAAQDVEKGKRSFFKCLPCHAVGPGAENKVGPELNGLDRAFGRYGGGLQLFRRQ